MMTDADRLLANPDTMLAWDEPWGGMDAKGNVSTVNVQSRATVRDCILISRMNTATLLSNKTTLGDKTYLLDFIAINLAYELEE